jgi:hypothetical protein
MSASSLPRHVPLPIFYSPKKLVRERAKWIQPGQEERFDEMIEKGRDVLEVDYYLDGNIRHVEFLHMHMMHDSHHM